MKQKLLLSISVLFLLALPFVYSANPVETHWYKFEDDLTDDGVDNDALTDEGSIVYVAGKVGSKAVQLDGSTDYLTSTAFSTSQITNLSFSVWMKTSDISTSTRFFTIMRSGGWLIEPGFNTDNFIFSTWDGANKDASKSISGLSDSWIHVVGTVENGQAVKVYINTSVSVDGDVVGTLYTPPISNFFLGSGDGGTDLFGGEIDDLRLFYGVVLNQTSVDCLNKGGQGQAESLSYALDNDLCTAEAPIPTFSNNKRNITTPLQNDHVGFNITITAPLTTTLSGYIFAYDNGTSGQFYNSSFQEIDGTETIVNVTFNKTIYNASGVTWQWKWFANDSEGAWGESSVYLLIVGGTTPPNVTIHSNNFFNAENTSYFNLVESKTVLLNVTFTDDFDLYGFEINITNADNTECFYYFNTTLNGTIDNVSITLNITNSSNANCVLEGYYTVNITGWDSHTAMAISDYKVDTGKDYLIFDDTITISADNALTSKAIKLKDRYNFEFTYRTWLTPKTKVFYIESDNVLTYKTTGYKAHFVDWVSKKWIDFEGLEGQPIITKINDYKYRIEYANEDEKVVFNSIGGLNSQSDYYKYYLVNTVVDWILPTTSPSFFTNNSIVIILNVSSKYRNETRFKIYNLSHDLIDSFNISNNGTGDYFYNHTFSGTLTETPYYVNATHYDLTGFATNSTTLVFVTAFFNVLFYDEISAALLTDTINLEVVGNFFAANFSTTNGKIQVPGWILEEYKLVYTSDNHAIREYYITFTNITNQTLNLYMLSTGNATEVTFIVQDNSGNELQNATIRLKRYYVSTNSYIIIAMARTNEEGETIIDVDFNDAYYQISVTYGDFSLETIGSRIISLTRILTLNLIPSPFDIPDAIAGVTTSLTFNNVTQTFSYVFTDLNGVSRKGTLEVYISTATTSALVCTATDTTSSGTLLCVVNTTGIPGTYTAKGFININPKLLTNTLQIFTGVVHQFKAIWGSQGIFFTILIAGTLGGLGAVISPAVGIIMFLVGIAIASFLGMSIISMVFLAFLILAAAVIIFKMKR